MKRLIGMFCISIVLVFRPTSFQQVPISEHKDGSSKPQLVVKNDYKISL